MREIMIPDELASAAMWRGDYTSAEEPRYLWFTPVARMGPGFNRLLETPCVLSLA